MPFSLEQVEISLIGNLLNSPNSLDFGNSRSVVCGWEKVYLPNQVISSNLIGIEVLQHWIFHRSNICQNARD